MRLVLGEGLKLALGLALTLLVEVASAQAQVQAVAVAPAASAAAGQPVSATARRVYERSRSQLLQIRTLLKDQDSQASVGSGFVVSSDGHIITNYHVVSQVALEPSRYRLQYETTDGRQGALELLAFDVRHDLALVRAKPEELGAQGVFSFRPQETPLVKGDRIYSMGNPHDVAFAVVEGTYNGLVERSFDPLIYYSGSINPGMSGGPVVDEDDHVVGINVSTLMFSQQMSFLVPGQFAEALFERSRNAKPITMPVWPQLREQLLAYQDELVNRFMAQPWRTAGPTVDSSRSRGAAPSGRIPYKLPVPQETYMRCWGRGTPTDTKGLDFQRSQCQMEHALFINGALQTGYFDVSHEIYDGTKLGALRFAEQYSGSFHNEPMGGNGRDLTAPFCKEEFIVASGPEAAGGSSPAPKGVDSSGRATLTPNGLPLRAVACMRAYRKLKGLYDLSVLVTTVDASTDGALGRFNARGVSFDNALKLTTHYLGGFGWSTPR